MYFNLLSIIFLRGVGAASLLISTAMVAQRYSLEEVSNFFLGTIIVTLGSLVSRLGVENIILSEFSPLHFSKSDGQSSYYLSVLKLVTYTSLLIITFVSVIHYFFGIDGASSVYDSPLIILTLSIFPISVFTTNSDFLKAKEYAFVSVFLKVFIFPLLFTVGFFLMDPESFIDACRLFTLCSLFVCLLSMVLTRLNFSFSSDDRSFNYLRLLKRSLPMLLVGLCGLTVGWLDGLILRFWGEESDLALYGVAVRLSALIGFVGLAILSIYGPKLSKLIADKEYQKCKLLLFHCQKMSFVLGLCFLAIGFLWGISALELFGDEYKESYWVFMVLMFSQFINVVFGPVGFLLVVFGKEKRYSLSYILISSFCLMAGVLIVPYAGIMGLAFLSVVFFLSINLLCYYEVRLKFQKMMAVL